MVKEKITQENPDFQEVSPDWLSDLSKISLLAEYMEMAFKENCDCRVCQKLRDRAKAFIQLTQKLPKF